MNVRKASASAMAASREPEKRVSESILPDSLSTTWIGLVLWAAAGTIAMVAFASACPAGTRVRVLAMLGLLAAASASFGGLLGFLFGVPRSQQVDRANGHGGAPVDATAAEAAASGSPSASGRTRIALRANTNLEEISDWLTKILVGVGLTQFDAMSQRTRAIVAAAAPEVAQSAPAVAAVLTTFVIWGFFASYLATRLFLSAAFVKADELADNSGQIERTALALAKEGKHEAAATTFAVALSALPADADADARRRLTEGQVFNALYEAPPKGFENAIEVAEAYLRSRLNPPSARLHMYLSCAYGQKYAYISRRGAPDPDELKMARDRALRHAREALHLEPKLRTLLHGFWAPDAEGTPGVDDDLAVFRHDPDFAELLGGS